jgi:hypothetical protein
MPEEALEAQQVGATDPLQQSFAGLMRCYVQSAEVDMGAMMKAYPL